MQFYGYTYDYLSRSIKRTGKLPPWARTIARRIHEDGLSPHTPAQLAVNEYEPGQGIFTHVDADIFLADEALSVGDKPFKVKCMKKLKEIRDGAPRDVTVGELFKGRRVVLFAVPGAFTPTCSMKHLPGFVTDADKIRAKGVDEIVCVSVNDAFVMDAWGKASAAAGKVRMLADGNGDFTRAVGLELDASGFGMGKRSQRYGMVVKDGKVEQLHVEPGPGLNVCSAESMLGKL